MSKKIIYQINLEVETTLFENIHIEICRMGENDLPRITSAQDNKIKIRKIKEIGRSTY